MTIQSIIAALVALISSWKNPVNIENDISDAVLALTTAQNVDPQLAFAGSALKFVNKTAAGLANVESGQAAVVATAAIDGATYLVTIEKQGGTAAGSLGV